MSTTPAIPPQKESLGEKILHGAERVGEAVGIIAALGINEVFDHGPNQQGDTVIDHPGSVLHKENEDGK